MIINQYKNQVKIYNSLLLSKYIHYNNYTIPKYNLVKVTIPFLEMRDIQKSEILFLVLDFLKKITGSNAKGVLKSMKILLKKGYFLRCQIMLTTRKMLDFVYFLKYFLLGNSLLKYSYRTLKVLPLFNNCGSLIVISDVENFFDSFLRKLFPILEYFWMEIEFYVNKNYKLCGCNKNIERFLQQLFQIDLL